MAGTLLEASGVVPVNVAARARPSERTIRFYVMKGLVDPPEGRGTAAVYRSLGSIGLMASVRVAMLVAIDRTDRNRRVLTVSKSRRTMEKTVRHLSIDSTR